MEQYPYNEYVKSVCRFDLLDESDRVIGGGSGFHYGGGWVITNTRVVGEKAENIPRMRITFQKNHPVRVYYPAARTCFIIQLNHGRMPSADVAFVLLEDDPFLQLPPAINSTRLPAVPLVYEIHERHGKGTYCLHYGYNPHRKPLGLQMSTKETITQIQPALGPQHSQIITRDNIDNTYAGSSGLYAGACGAPVFDHSSNELIGIQYSKELAVAFQPSIKKIMDKLLIATREIKALPEMSNTLAIPDDEIRRSTEDVMLPVIMHVLRTLGDSAPHMQVYLPVQNEMVMFSVVR